MTDHPTSTVQDDSSSSDHGKALLDFVRQEVCLIPVDLDLETDLLLTGAVDSLGVIRITQWLEDEFDIEVDPTEVTLDNFQTVGLIVNYSRRKGAAI